MTPLRELDEAEMSRVEGGATNSGLAFVGQLLFLIDTLFGTTLTIIFGPRVFA